MSVRRGHAVAYAKSKQTIRELLAHMGAHDAVLSVDEAEVISRTRERANRATNCDEANLARQGSAARAQAEAIAALDIDALGAAPAPGRRAAPAPTPTCRWPSSAGLARPPLSKSTVAGRMRLLMSACGRYAGRRPAADDQVVPAELGLVVHPLPPLRQPLDRPAGRVDRRRRPRPPVPLQPVAHLDRDGRPEAAQRPQLDDLEARALEQVAQPLGRVAVEVAGVVDRPEERGGGDDVAARLEQAKALREGVRGTFQMLEHLGQEHRLGAAVGERDVVGGRDHVDRRAAGAVLVDMVDAHVLAHVRGEDRLPRLAAAADVDQAAAGVAGGRVAQAASNVRYTSRFLALSLGCRNIGRAPYHPAAAAHVEDPMMNSLTVSS